MGLPNKNLPLIHYDTKAEYEARVAAMTTEERVQYNAFYLGFVAETREFHAKGNTYKCGREWEWDVVSGTQADANDFVSNACVGDTLLLSGSELSLILSKEIGTSTAIVTAITQGCEHRMIFTTSDAGKNWSAPSAYNTEEYIYDSAVRTDAEPNSIVMRGSLGEIAGSYFKSEGVRYAMPYRNEDDADYVLQERIDDIETIRTGAAKGATAVQKAGDTMTGTLNTRALVPTANKTYNIGSSSLKYKEVHAERVNADLLSDGTETYALPSASDTTKESATGGVLATEDTVMKFSNDLTGVPIATPEEFTFRPSAGDKSIRDESAVIRCIKGNTLVWNQIWKTSNIFVNVIRTNVVYNGDVVSMNHIGGSNTAPAKWAYYKQWLEMGHKFYVAFVGRLNGQCRFGVYSGGDETLLPLFSGNGNEQLFAAIGVTNDSAFTVGGALIGIDTTLTFDTSTVQVVDLTQMFGAGNEPTSIEEFYARIPVGVDINAYNEGQLVNLNPSAIKTTGFNQWDEQWELGNINTSTGDNMTSSNSIRSKEYIPIIGGLSYYFYKGDGQEMGVYAYDSNYNFIGVYAHGTFQPSVGSTNITNKSIALPSNARYIKFRVFPITSATYNNDICINLSHTGYRDGEYEEYKEHNLDISWIKKYFPNGMRSAGTARDEIRYNSTTQQWEAVQRVGVVDLGSLSWTLAGTRFVSSGISSSIVPPTATSVVAMIVCSKYLSITADTSNVGIAIHPNGAIWVYDSSYTDATAFKAAMSGVMLNYELAEPIVTEITDIVQMDYWVGDFGTEELISDTASTAFNADIVYQFNAEGRIRDNERNIENLAKSKLDNPNGTSSQFIKGDGSLDIVLVSLEVTRPNANGSVSGVISQDIYNEILNSKIVQFDVGDWIITPSDCVIESEQERTYGVITVATGIFEAWRFAFAPSTTSGYVDYTVTRKTLSIT